MKKSKSIVLLTILIAATILIIYACKKDFDRQAAVITKSVDLPTAKANGSVIDLGHGTITDHGFCWDSLNDPSIDKSKLNLGGLASTGDYSGQLTGLKPIKTYYLRAFVLYGETVEYGDMISFTTPDLPTITTSAVTAINNNGATSGGNITTDGGAPVLSRGVCWNTSSNPDLTSNHTIDSIGTGSFASTLFGLMPNTQYYVRAYGTNIYGTRFGNEVSFNTGQDENLPIVSTAEVTSIATNTATAGGNVISDGGSAVTSRGVCWSTSPYPTTENSKTTDGSGTGQYTSNLTGLTVNTTYYVRGYAVNEKGTGYGDEKSFTTKPNPVVPTVTTKALSNITSTTATTGGVVLLDGGATVSSRGVCWSTNPNPTTADGKTIDGSGVGSFTSQLTGLTNGTKYYVRAYATNKIGTSYGNEISFIAGQNITSPTVTTTDVINIAQTTATCGGNVTNDGGAFVTARGVCWSTTANPTTANSHTTDGSGTGGYLSSLTGLTANTTYHVRAYATNSVGTSYGNEKIFSTLPEVVVPSVTTAPATNITNNSAQSGGTITNNGGANVIARGVCYGTTTNPTISGPHTTDGSGNGSFVSQMTGIQSSTFYYVRAYATNSAGTAYGNQQSFSTLQDPILPTVTTAQVTNITQTTATTGGTVVSDGGSPVTTRGVCYSSNPNPTLADTYTSNGSGMGSFVSNLSNLTPGTMYYVRAYATNTVGTAYGNEISFTTLTSAVLPTVTTDTATNITQTTATSGGNVISDGGATVTARGVCWSTSSGPTTSDNHTSNGSGTGAFVSNLTGLTENTFYYVRAYATNSVGTAYGNEIFFTTLAPWQCGNTLNYSGQNYATVIIGTQCWMKENLNIGVMISSAQNQTNNEIIEKYCYNNDPAICNVYGGLYQWDETMQYTTAPGAQGICPVGWHIPTSIEYCTLLTYLDGTVDCNSTSFSGTDAGGKMKETGYQHWNPPNTGATNSSGFTGLPSGEYNFVSGFSELTLYTIIWSSTEAGNDVKSITLGYSYQVIGLWPNLKLNGNPLRCLKN